MATLDEIRNSDFYINASPDVKQKIESNYAKENPSQPIADKPGIVQGANVQPDIPSTNPESYKPVANGQSWESIVRSDFFQNADNATRDRIRNNFSKEGGKLPTSGEELINAGLTASGSIANETLKQVGGAGYYTLGLLKEVDKGVNSLLGTDPKDSLLTQYANKGQENLSNAMRKLENSYQENVGQMAKESALLRNTEQYAPMVEQGVEAIATGGASLLPHAIGYAGEHYFETPEEKRDLARSTTMGGVNYAMGRFIPGSKVANRLESALFDNVASPAVKTILAKGAGAAVAGGEGAGIGYATGFTSTGADQLMAGATPQEALKNAHEAGKESAVFGGVFGAGFHAVTPNKNIKFDQKTSDRVKQDVDNINESFKAGDFKARDNNFNTAEDHVFSNAADNLAQHGFEPIKQSAQAGKSAEKAYGTTAEEANSKPIDIESTKTNLEETQSRLKETRLNADSANNDLFERMNKPSEDEVKSGLSKEADAKQNEFLKTISALHSEQTKLQKFNPEEQRRLATKAHELYNDFHALAPEQAEYFADNYTSPITGKKGNFDLQNDVHTNIAQRKILDATKEGIKPTGKRPTLKDMGKSFVEHGVKHAIVNHLFGPVGNALYLTGGKVMGYGKEQVNANRRMIQAKKMNQNVSEARSTAAEVETPVKTSGDFTTDAGRAEARRIRTLKAAVNEAKAKFADHPDIAAKINESNYRDLTPFAQERAQARTTARQEARAAEKAAQAKQEADTNKQQVREFKEANEHLKPFFRDAENNVKASGKELTSHNFEKAVNNLATGKTANAQGEKVRAPFKAGSREEYAEDIRKNKLIPEEVKNEQRALVQLYHKGLKPGENLPAKSQRDLHRSLAEIESNFHKSYGNTNEAKLATERGEAFAERVNKRGDIALRNKRIDDLHSTINESLKDAGISERKINKFIKDKTNELNGKTFKNESKFKDYIESVRAEANALKAPEPTAKPKSTTTKKPTEEEGGLSDTQITHTREKYTHELTDSLGSKDFDKQLDELEAFREEYDLPDTATNARFDHYVDALTKIHELKLKGINDPQALVSQEMMKRITKPGIQYGKWLRESIGIDASDILPEVQRKQLEAESTTEKVKARQEEAALKQKQAQNRQERAERKAKLQGGVKRSRNA